ncbi:MAG: hypothetical protein AAGJ79_05070 [Verrucomicrobiota bacterium]
MKRGHFLSLGILTTVGAATSALANTPKMPFALRRWSEQYQAELLVAENSVQLRAKVARVQLGECLQSLARLTNGPLHATGNTLKGSCDGTAFEVHLLG